MRRTYCLLTALLMAASLWLPCAALEAENPPENGYLFQLKNPVSGFRLQSVDGVEAVDRDHGLYAADTMEAVYDFADGRTIVAIEPNITVTLMDAPDDPWYQSGTQWERDALEINQVWEAGFTGEDVRVGIVDSGVYAAHEDLAGANIVQGYDYIEEDDDPQDTQGHGTFATGIIAAQVNNGLGIAGIAPNVEIVPLKCFDNTTTTMECILAAIYDGVDDYGCNILNLSLGTEESSELLENAIKYADAKGVLMVASAGNDGDDAIETDPLNYPAAYEEVIGVGSVTNELLHSSFSQKNDSVWVTAPGSNLYGLGIAGADSYKNGSGTSFSAPCITGLLALVLQEFPDVEREEMMEALKTAAEDLGDPGWDNQYGWGFVTATALLSQFEKGPPEVEIQKDEDGWNVQVTYTDKIHFDQVNIFAAAYDASGAMVSAAILEPDSQETVFVLKLTGENIQKIKVFTLDKMKYSPACPAGEIVIES